MNEKIEKDATLSALSAWDELYKLKGIEPVIQKLKELVNHEKNTKNAKIRPHLAFCGNPGTGKTTVAHLFAKILNAENILKTGHIVSVTVGDLVGNYVGETRIKTQKQCEKASGGILYIDEAYGLYEKNEQVNFGKEAIEVLLQFMENDHDSLVILAGYKDEIEEMLNKANPGLSRRIPQANRILFEDYTPEVLMEIAESMIKEEGISISEEAYKKIFEIIIKAHRQKKRTFGNAGYVEELIHDILYEYYSSEDKNNTVEIKHLRNLIRFDTTNANKEMEDLDKMIGLQALKMAISLNKLLNLNFVFTGNPGTGKTTVAKKMGAILYNYGLLSSDDVIEVGRSNVIGKYLGHTALSVKELFDKAVGKTLFIDEVYSLCQGENDFFGKEAIDEIVRCLTDDMYIGKMAVIIAGYTDEVNEFIDKNPGMRSRFSHYVSFEDYTDEELWQILYKHATDENLKFEEGCDKKAIDWFSRQPRDKGFANGRLATEHLLPALKSNLESRIEDSENEDKEFFTTILMQDFPDVTQYT